MIRLETEEKKMPEDTSENPSQKQEEVSPASQKGKIEESDADPYLRNWYPNDNLATNELGKSRKPIWDILNDPGEKAVLERRAFIEGLKKKTVGAKALQEAQIRWDERQKVREQRRADRKATPEIPKTTFRDRLRNISRGIEGFLSQPAQEARRLREAEVQSNKAYREIFNNQGKRLRGASGFLRGVAASAFKGIGKMSTKIGEGIKPKPKQPLSSGVSAPEPGAF